jgi:hypothetical protein
MCMCVYVFDETQGEWWEVHPMDKLWTVIDEVGGDEAEEATGPFFLTFRTR